MSAQVSDPLIGHLHPFPTKGFESAKIFAGIPQFFFFFFIPQFFCHSQRGPVLKDQLKPPLVIALVWLFFLVMCSVYLVSFLLNSHSCQ